jgi:hypothetical protein
VMVDRVTAGGRVAGSRDEQDYPAAATDREGNVWVAYAQFTPNPKFTGIRWSGTGETKNFAELAEPTGGDQIMLMNWSRGAWSEAVAVTEKGGDLYKPAVASDGSGRVWVFWSANNGGAFDLYARSFEAGKGGKTLKLTSPTQSEREGTSDHLAAKRKLASLSFHPTQSTGRLILRCGAKPVIAQSSLSRAALVPG